MRTGFIDTLIIGDSQAGLADDTARLADHTAGGRNRVVA